MIAKQYLEPAFMW